MRSFVPFCIALVGCSSSKPAAKGELCIAENRPEHLMKMSRETGDVDDVVPDEPPGGDPVVARPPRERGWLRVPMTEKLALVARDQRIAVPNGEVLLRDARGLNVKMYVDDENTETVHLDFDFHKTDKLCLYFRPAKDLSFTQGWILDAAGNAPRCHCWD